MFRNSSDDIGYRKARGRQRAGPNDEGGILTRALHHPFGLALLAVSLALSLAMAFVPSMERWSTWAPWVLGWGVLFFAVSILAISRTRPMPNEQEMRDLEAVRQMIASRIKSRRSSEGWSRSAVTRSLEAVHEELEHDIMPAMAELLELQRELTAGLKELEESDVNPAPEAMRRLKDLHNRRGAIIAEAVQQAADAAASAIEVIQQQEQVAATEEAQTAADRLKDMFSALRGAMEPGFLGVSDVPPVSDPDPVTKDMSVNGNTPSNAPVAVLPTDDELEPVTEALEAALKVLNRPPKLATCGLVDLLPCLARREWKRNEPDSPLEPTPLELGAAIRQVVVQEIEHLKPRDAVVSSGNRAMEQFIILHEQYVVGRMISQIRTRLHLEDRTYHYHRKDAIGVLALHLAAKEAQVAAFAESAAV